MRIAYVIRSFFVPSPKTKWPCIWRVHPTIGYCWRIVEGGYDGREGRQSVWQSGILSVHCSRIDQTEKVPLSLQPQEIGPVPVETARVAQAAFPRGTVARRWRDTGGLLYKDADFAALFPPRGQPAEAPWRLAVVSVRQAAVRINAPDDTQARDRSKRTMTWTGDTVQLTETCDDDTPHLRIDVQTTVVTTQDVELTAPVQEALVAKEAPPRVHIVDEGYTEAALLVTSRARDLPYRGHERHVAADAGEGRHGRHPRRVWRRCLSVLPRAGAVHAQRDATTPTDPPSTRGTLGVPLDAAPGGTLPPPRPALEAGPRVLCPHDR